MADAFYDNDGPTPEEQARRDAIEAQAYRRREAEAAMRIRHIVQSEQVGLGDGPVKPGRIGLGRNGIDDAATTLGGHAPGYGPDMTARQIEGVYGRFGDIPGWSNARELAEASMDRARTKAESASPGSPDWGVQSDEFIKNKSHLMTPAQAEYMQNIGRFVDLLRDLRKPKGDINSTNPGVGGQAQSIYNDVFGGTASAPSYLVGPNQAALHYWDKSANKARSREDYDDPNYSRWAGAGRASQRFMEDSASPVSRYLQVQRLIPSYIQASAEVPQGGLLTNEPAQRAGNLYSAQDRWRLTGEGGEVLDIPSLPKGATPEERAMHALQYFERRRQANQTLRNLAPYPMQNAVNDLHAWQHERMPFYEGDAEPMPAVIGDTVQLAADMVDGSLIAGLAAGIPSRMAALARSGAKYTLAPAVFGEAWQQAYPEIGIGGALNYATSDPTRSVEDYVTKPQPSYQLDREARDEAHRTFENLHRTDPQSIRATMLRAYEQARRGRQPDSAWPLID